MGTLEVTSSQRASQEHYAIQDY